MIVVRRSSWIVNYTSIEMGGFSSRQKSRKSSRPHDAPNPETYPGPRLSLLFSNSLLSFAVCKIPSTRSYCYIFYSTSRWCYYCQRFAKTVERESSKGRQSFDHFRLIHYNGAKHDGFLNTAYGILQEVTTFYAQTS